MPKHPSYNPELLDVFESLKDKMLFTFSDAHLDDLKDSEFEYAKKDLLVMERYVKDNYFAHYFVKDLGTSVYLATPLTAFQDKNYKLYNEVLENPYDLDHLFSEFDDFPELGMVKSLLKTMYSVPIGAFAGYETREVDDKGQELIDRMVPGYNPFMTIGDFMQGMWPYSKSLLHDKKEFTELRRYIASYMKNDEYGFEKWGMAFNERMKNSTIGKSYLEMIENMLSTNQKKDLYQKFNYAYTLLETYNVTQERKKKGLKQFNMQSLNTDAHHAWFGSFNDYLITDDKGLQIKANIVYQLLKLPTKVLSSKDFINYKTIILGQEETIEKFSSSLNYDLKHSLLLSQEPDLLSSDSTSVFIPTHPYFNYFNRYQLNEEKKSITFFCNRKSHASFMMYREIQLLIRKLNLLLGEDIDNRGEYEMNENEKYKDRAILRTWFNGNYKFAIYTSYGNWGSSVCLNLESF